MKRLEDICVRYFILLIVSFFSPYVFYWLFGSITLYFVYFLFSFFGASLEGGLILFNGFEIELIGSCIAGSAYYFLFVLNLSVGKMKLDKRVRAILFSFGIFFVFNVLRIFVMGFIYNFDYAFFDFIHKILWYFFSVVFVVCIWFLEVRFFRIKDIPFYSDFKFVYRYVKRKWR